jgi:hypothetical protein
MHGGEMGFTMKKTILLISIILFNALLINCTQPAPQSATVPEEEVVVTTPEPVLLLCVVCDELKVEGEHCFDWQSEMIERNNARRAEREAQEERDAADKAAYEAARLEAWKILPEDEREEWMAQTRADTLQWWDDLIQEEFEVMPSLGFMFSPKGEGVRKVVPLPDYIKAPPYDSDLFGEDGDYWARVKPELLSADNKEIHIGWFDYAPWETILALGFADFNVYGIGAAGDLMLELFGELGRVTKGHGGGYVFFENTVSEIMVVPLSYVLCITDRMWMPECVCEMPPDFQP